MSKTRSGGQQKEKLAVVIQAADKGTRLKSNKLKVLHQVGGKTLLSHVIAAASRLVDAKSIVVVVEYEAERVRNAVVDSGVQFVEHAAQRGTGQAIQSALKHLSRYENVLVLSGDLPLIRTETLERLWGFHQTEDAAMTILTVEQRSLGEIDSGIYAVKTWALEAHLDALHLKKARGNSLGNIAKLLRDAGKRVAVVQADNAAEVLGANSLAELAELDARMRAATAQRLMAAGVTIYRPDTCVIDSDVEVQADTVIEPYVQLLGRTRIGAETTVRSYSVIENCTIGDRVTVRQSCVLADSSVGDGADIGPFARLRPGTEIGKNVHIGNFVEVKKSKLHDGVKAGHLAYLGDSEIGAGTNIGAGVITCNYDGVNKHRTRIGEGAFVGSDSTLVAPVTIEDGAYIGAGSCITKDVPAGALAVGRGRQVNKEGWAEARRAHLKLQEKA